jgi:hypothetical protein
LVWRRRSVRSALGWPVPADPRIASSDEMTNLVNRAEQRGFSRQTEDLHPEGREIFAVLPCWPESTPEASWRCMVVRVDDWNPPTGSRPGAGIALVRRLDVTLADFAALRRARRRQRDQLLHWMTWLATNPRTVRSSGVESQLDDIERR